MAALLQVLAKRGGQVTTNKYGRGTALSQSIGERSAARYMAGSDYRRGIRAEHNRGTRHAPNVQCHILTASP
jgi:hypothetical protein